jgi:hypothetical protein
MFIDFMKSYDSVRKEVFNDIVPEFEVPMK